MKVSDLSSGMATLTYFNSFHDGFIKSFEIISADSFAEIGVQDLTGSLNVEIMFAHYNYPDAQRGVDQTVTGSFSEVRDIHLDFSGQRTDWPISSSTVREAKRMGDYGMEPCLVFELSQRRGAGELMPVLAFTFKQASFD